MTTPALLERTVPTAEPVAPARAPRGPVDPRLLRHARSSRAGVAGLALIGTGQAAATLTVAVALSLIVAGETGWTIGAPGPPGGQHWTLWLLGAAFVARAALSWAEQVVAQRTAAKVAGELRREMVRAVLHRGPGWAAHFGTGRLTAVLTNGLDALRPWFGSYLPALVLGITLPPLVVVAIALVDPASAVITLLTLPLIPVLGALIGWATQARARQRWAADARLAGHFLDVVRGLPTLRIFGRADRQTATIADLTDQHRSATLRVLRVAFLSSTALDLVGTLSVGLIAVEAGLRVAAGDLPLGPALLVILLAPEAYRPLREMAARYHAAADATAVISDVDEILRDGHAAPAPGGGRDVAEIGIFATGVRARYAAANGDALALPELVVHGGEIVALQGPSGAGKTTALRVLAGLHPGAEGLFTAAHPHYLPQRPALPHARTVADLFAATPAEINEALRTVGLAGELTAATPLGDRGTGVSAGQRHRLALAALLHRAGREPATLLLDEPTAHLDAATEAQVIAHLRAAADAGSAILVVAHRPALLAAADRTVALTAPPANTPATSRPALSGTAPAAPSRDLARPWRRPWVAVALGSGSALAGLLLTGAAAWLLVRAATLPPVLTLSTAVVLVRGNAVARPLLRYLERLVAHDVAFTRLGSHRSRVYAALIPRVPGPRLRRRGDLLSRVVDDVDARVDGLLRGRLPMLTTGVTLAVAVPVVIALAPAAAAPLAAGLLIAGLVAPAIAARQATRADAATAQARSHLRDAMVETVDGLEESPADAVPEKRSVVLARLEAKAARTAGGATALAHLGWGVAVIGTALALTGLTAEWAAVLLLAVVVLGETLLTLPDAAAAQRRATAADRRITALTDDPPAAIFPAVLPPGPQAADPGSVKIRNLTAGWDPAREPAFVGLDLDLAPGERLAVLGRSGSGKSTLGAVLARLLDPHEGTVEFGGADALTLPEDTVRTRVVLVGDDTGHIFASTVRENLRLARPDADDAAMKSVLSRVRLDDFTLDTWLGSGGSTMSGGQARRFATARALLADPPLLILDEPTEGLDAPAAEALMADLLDAAHGRTVLLLTHRTEGLDRCDRQIRL